MRIALRDVIKSPDVEDPINLHVHRSLQLLLVRPLMRTSITPNQVTFLSLVAGLSSAAAIAHGHLLAGAALLFSSAILDGVDGMIARLKKASSETGHAYDGAADYAVNLATTVAAALHLARVTGRPLMAFGLALLAHVAWAHHLMLYDFQAATFLRVLTRGRHAGGDLLRGKVLLARLRDTRAPWPVRAIVAGYVFQLGNRQRFLERVLPAQTREARFAVEDPEGWVDRHRASMRLWAWLGNAPHMDGMVLAAAADRFDVYFLARIVGFTALAIALSARARRLEEVTA
ncbi:MAG: CDP-alcohol phosphatidyltransferase family protein [Polyangiales bacterium]